MITKNSLVKLEKKQINQINKFTESNKQHFNTKLPKSVIKQIKVYCAENEITIQQFMLEAVEAMLK